MRPTDFIGNETRKLEESLLRFTPYRQWQIVTVTFPSAANVDLDIIHNLSPTNPENVDAQVLQASGAMSIYKDMTVTRIPWQAGLIRLRSSAASVQAVLLLSVADGEDSRTRLG